MEVEDVLKGVRSLHNPLGIPALELAFDPSSAVEVDGSVAVDSGQISVINDIDGLLPPLLSTTSRSSQTLYPRCSFEVVKCARFFAPVVLLARYPDAAVL